MDLRLTYAGKQLSTLRDLRERVTLYLARNLRAKTLIIYAAALLVLGLFPIILNSVSYVLFDYVFSYPNLFTLFLLFFAYCIYVYIERDDLIKRLSVAEIDDLKDGVEFKRLRFSAPLLQSDTQFDSPNQLHAWLANTKTGWDRLADAAASSSLEKFAHHAKSMAALMRIVRSSAEDNKYGPLKSFQRACREEKMLSLGTPLAQLVFDDAVAIDRRLFAVATFINSETVGREFGRAPEDHPLDSTALLEELALQRPHFKERESGFRTVYEITIRGVGAYLQTTANLNRQASQIDRYLKAATVKAQLGPAAARWKSKARWHRFGALVGISPFLLILALPVVYFDEIASFVRALWIMDAQTKTSITTWSQVLKDAPFAITAIVTVPALMLAWILRHFSRMFVQNLNLSADAGNRSAISDVYARMIAQGSDFSPETQKIVIESLFGAGTSRHEEISQSPIEQVFEAIKSKPS